MPPDPACRGYEEILKAVQALQGGAPPDAFEIVFRCYFRPLQRFFANRPALRDEAEDLAQATLQRAYEKIGQYRAEAGASFAAWLRRIAENVWKNAVRERQAAKRVPPAALVESPAKDGPEAPPLPDPRPGPEEIALARERTRLLREAIESLPAGMRRCAELRLFGDLKYQEIAAVTGIGLNSVRSQLFEARQRLKPVLDDHFQGADL